MSTIGLKPTTVVTIEQKETVAGEKRQGSRGPKRTYYIVSRRDWCGR
jgi:hypothetical protein